MEAFNSIKTGLKGFVASGKARLLILLITLILFILAAGAPGASGGVGG